VEKLAEFLIRIKARVTEGNCGHNMCLNKLQIVLKYELSKVRNFGNENVATCKNVVKMGANITVKYNIVDKSYGNET
jgi:hypothetical protein